MTRTEAKDFVAALAAMRDGATDEQASNAVVLYPTLKGNGALVKAGIRINWQGTIKRAAVDLWDNAENTPETTPALWEDIGYREGVRIIPETITAGTAFSAGERGWWGDVLYRSLIDSNVWTPDAYLEGWEEVTV